MRHPLLLASSLLFILLLPNYPLRAQGDLFDDTTLLKVSMVSDWQGVLQDRGDSSSFHKARLTYQDADGKNVMLRIRVRSRGHFRRNPQVCDFPPLKVKIEKEERQNTLFAKHKNLKLVCHCKEEEAILKEYLVYKTYELLSPYAFRVRLAEITYVDLNNDLPPTKHYGFFIEDDKRMAKRLGGKRFQGELSSEDSCNRSQLAMVHAFMYMIGNMDWNVDSRKNIKTISLPNVDKLVVVPYDFDWSGAVGASYVLLPENFDRRDMKGLCASAEEWDQLANIFLEKEGEIKSLIKNFERLSTSERTDMLHYYKFFLRQIQKKDRMVKHFVEPCQAGIVEGSGG